VDTKRDSAPSAVEGPAFALSGRGSGSGLITAEMDMLPSLHCSRICKAPKPGRWQAGAGRTLEISRSDRRSLRAAWT